jgi:hypothetical protein
MAAAIAAFAIIQALMPAVSDGAHTLAASGDGVDAKFTRALVLSEMATPDDVTIDLWAKNAGASKIDDARALSVAFGSDANPRPYRYGGSGCVAPCWEYMLDDGGPSWDIGETMHIRVHLAAPVRASSWYRATVGAGPGGQATRLFRVNPGLAPSTPTPLLTVTPTSTPTP